MCTEKEKRCSSRKVLFSFMIDEETKHQLKEYCLSHNTMSMSECIRRSIRSFVSKGDGDGDDDSSFGGNGS